MPQRAEPLPAPGRHRRSPPRRRWGPLAAVANLAAVTIFGYAALAKDPEVGALQQKVDQLQHQVDRSNDIDGRLNKVDPNTFSGRSLGSITDLPAYGRKVTAQQRELLAGSSLQLLGRDKGTIGTWYRVCNANKVILHNQVLIETASHCFGEERERISMNSLNVGRSATYDVSQLSKWEFVAAEEMPSDAKDKSYPADRLPLAYISAIAVNMTGIDIALLQPDTQHGPVRTLNGRPVFDTLPALQPRWNSPPAAGQEVALHSMPSEARGLSVDTVGIALGRIFVESFGAFYDVVGVPGVSTRGNDPCNYGASGSHAMFGDGFISSPLTYANAIGFGYGQRPANPPDKIEDEQRRRLKLEEALGKDLTEFPTLCLYGANPGRQNITRMLEQSFGHFPPPEIIQPPREPK